MNIKAYLDTRRIKDDGECALTLSIAYKGKSALMPLGLSISPDRWNGVSVCKGRDKERINQMIAERLLALQSVCKEIILHNDDLTATQLKNLAQKKLGGNFEFIGRMGVADERGSARFYEYFCEHIKQYTKKNTFDKYDATRKWIEKYDNNYQVLTFDDIDKRWLEGFDRFMTPSSPSANSRAIHMRNIRTVFNAAIDDDLTDKYPFRKFKIKDEPTRHRALTIEQLRTLWNYPCEEYQTYYLDYFKLSFLLIGIIPDDIYSLTDKDLINDRIIYDRGKTGKILNVKVWPEAMELIKKHKGKNGHLLDCADRWSTEKAFRDKCGLALKRIGRQNTKSLGLFPDLSPYWARHTWATVASTLRIPVDDISKALSHAIPRHVTSIYIDPNAYRVDDANRKVIDYVLQIGKGTK